MSLEDIASEVRACRLCGLSINRKNAVPGEGCEDANIIFIGEAPGADEDEKGRPFIGRAGKLLGNALEDAEILRKDVFITNIVKCRPPNNRPPFPGEVAACRPYLERQIKTIKPKLICLLGNTAAKTILNSKSIGKLRGKLVEKDGNIYYCTYHPAAALYDFKVKPIFYDDLKELKKLLKDRESVSGLWQYY